MQYTGTSTAAHLVLQPDASRLERILDSIGGGEVPQAAQAGALRHEIVDLGAAQRWWAGELESGSRQAEHEHLRAVCWRCLGDVKISCASSSRALAPQKADQTPEVIYLLLRQDGAACP